MERDGVAVGEAQWGLSIPVDPGAHTSKSSRSRQEGLAEHHHCRRRRERTNPERSRAGRRASYASKRPQPRPSLPNRALRTGAFVSIGVSGVCAVIGTVFGLRAISKNNASNAPDKCQGDTCVSRLARPWRNDARSAGTISTIASAVRAQPR